MYHTNYIKFCERARSEAFFAQGMIPAQNDNSGFVVRHISADFLATSKLGDMLHVTSKILTLKNSSLLLLQEIWREELKVFSMEVTLVYVDSDRPRRIPETFKTLFETL